MSAERGPDLRSYGRLGDAVICEMGGYCCWGCCALIPSLPNDMERGGGGGYDDQFMSSRDEGSVVAVQVAECDGAWGVKGEKAGVMGDSCGYDRHVALRSPGLEELGLASADIQLVMLGWPYSYVRVVDALEGTAGFLAPTDTASNRKETDGGGGGCSTYSSPRARSSRIPAASWAAPCSGCWAWSTAGNAAGRASRWDVQWGSQATTKPRQSWDRPKTATPTFAWHPPAAAGLRGRSCTPSSGGYS